MRIRRRIAALVSALMMLGIGAGIIVILVQATQGERGREWLRAALEARLEGSLQGKVHLGTLSGTFLTDLRTDSLEIRDRDDSVFVATGPIRVTFDPRDLIDGRIILRSAEITRPYFVMRRDTAGKWSHDKLWPKRGARRMRRSRSALGSVVVIEQAHVTDGQFVLMLPWKPADSLRGVRRDSAIAAMLARPEHETRRSSRDRYMRTWRWREIALDAPRVRIAYPDSAGRHFQIGRLDVAESDPPFLFKDIQGGVNWVGDSIWLDLPHFDLPGSTGNAAGKIVWGSGLPIRYRVRVQGDSVALRDVAWIDPSLPTSGGGSMVLDIANNHQDLDILEYAITALDVRSHRSRLRGRMTWGIGGAVTVLKDVDLEASPLDFDLLERFHQGPFPFPFRGEFTGRVRARGGPLNRFVVDDVTTRFRDANVAGAESRGSASGELDILRPAFTIFRGFDVAMESFDLRTAQFLNPEFPRVNGMVSGIARLDSSWLDVRVRDAELVHRDGDAPESRFRGTGRVTWGERLMAYEVEAQATPVSFTALARSYPTVPWRGSYSGPIRVRGTMESLALVTDLTGAAGRVTTELLLDAEPPGYRVSGRAALLAVDPRLAFDDARAPSGELTANVDLDVAGDSLANLRGDAQLAVGRSLLDGVRVFAGEARLRFADGKAIVDTIRLETSALELAAGGALGLHAGRDDSLRARATVDSLGGLRRWLARSTPDSLDGSLRFDAVVHGWVRDFATSATARGSNLLVRGTTVKELRATAELAGLPGNPAGAVALFTDTLNARGLGFTIASARATLDGSGDAEVFVSGTGRRGTLARGAGRLAFAPDTLRVHVDSFAVTTARTRWNLALPSSLVTGPHGFALDSLLLVADANRFVRLAGAVPRDSAIAFRVDARALPLADLAELLQLDGATEGHLDLDSRLTGTRAAPQLEGRAVLRGALLKGLRLDTLHLDGRASGDELRVNASLGAVATPTLRAEATLPLRLSLNGGGSRWLAEGPVRGRIRSDSVGLGLFESLTQGVIGDAGSLAVAIELGGTWRRPLFDGDLRVRGGTVTFAPLGEVRWRAVEADVGFVGDSVAVRRLAATSSTEGRTGRASITGWMTFADRENPLLDLRLTSRGFHAYSRRDVADVDISGDLRVHGAWRDATLRGALTADRAIVSIPELARKDVISLDDPDLFRIVDTSALLDERLMPSPPPTFVENLTVANVPITMGRDVWLRSSEANINLGGFVSITRGRVTRGLNSGQLQLALDGPLQTVRGTYRLNLGPVQRTFEVQSGEIRFYGDPDLNPTLDISALHTVRQYSQQGARPDVRVQVHLGGTLLSPTAELSTPDSVRVTNADLVSYLVTGGPSYEIAGRNGDYTSTAARVVLSSLGSVLGGKAAGGVCDDAQVSTAGLEGYGGRIQDVGGGILSGTRFSCAKQVGDRAFVRLDAGLCQVGQLVTQGGGSSPINLADAIGVKLDYLLSPGVTASVGVEPPSNALLCASNASARGFVPTPQQVGFDLFRSWRF